MSEVKITFNSDGFREIFFTSGTYHLVRDACQEIADKANASLDHEGFVVDTWVGNYGGGRINGSVTSRTNKAAIAEAENKVLSGAVN